MRARWIGRTVYAFIFLFVFVSLLRLGFWQFDRYQGKIQTLALIKHNAAQPPMTADRLMHKGLIAHSRLALNIRWVSDATLLLSGQFRGGKPGFTVITPVVWKENQPWLLVDRGFVSTVELAQHPHWKPSTHQAKIYGSVFIPGKARFILGRWQQAPVQHMPVVQDWQLSRLAHLLGHSVLPGILRLQKPSAQGFLIQPPSLSVGLLPRRHLAYSLQWWIFALIWLVGWALMYRKRSLS